MLSAFFLFKLIIFFSAKFNKMYQMRFLVLKIMRLLSTAIKKMLIKFFGNNFMLAKILFNIV
ncbi:MAG: hypothetical protein RIR31_1684 [Bacteroidota bacterium]|jgi:hypothetical protein